MHPVFQVALRSTFAIFPILIYCYVLKKKITLTNGSLIPGIVAGILFAIEFIFLFTALDYSTVTRVSLIFYTIGGYFIIISLIQPLRYLILFAEDG